jgi:hypothetical protein
LPSKPLSLSSCFSRSFSACLAAAWACLVFSLCSASFSASAFLCRDRPYAFRSSSPVMAPAASFILPLNSSDIRVTSLVVQPFSSSRSPCVHLKTGEVAYRAARTVELFAFSTKGLVAGALLNVLGGYANFGKYPFHAPGRQEPPKSRKGTSWRQMQPYAMLPLGWNGGDPRGVAKRRKRSSESRGVGGVLGQ